MVRLNPERALIAANAFLDALSLRTNNVELGLFVSMSDYQPGVGTGDPAMWWDWLAAIVKVQTGITFPHPRHRYLGPDMVRPLDPEQGYFAMFTYLEEYWNVVSRPPEIGSALELMRYTLGAGTADPSLWPEWLAAFEKAGKA